MTVGYIIQLSSKDISFTKKYYLSRKGDVSRHPFIFIKKFYVINRIKKAELYLYQLERYDWEIISIPDLENGISACGYVSSSLEDFKNNYKPYKKSSKTSLNNVTLQNIDYND